MKTRIAVVFAFIVLAPILVAVQNQPSGAQDRKGAQQTNPATPISVNCNCTAQTDDSKNKPQGWHKLVTWPEGIATWALILTLGAIVWQALETRSATEALRRNIALQFRPRLIVRRAELEYGTIQVPGGKPAKIHYTVANTGGIRARLVRIKGIVDYETSGIADPRTLKPFAPPTCRQEFDQPESVSLAAGEDRTLLLELDQKIFEKIRFLEAQNVHHVNNPRLVGIVSICADLEYTDEIGITRKTGIFRALDIDSRRFAPINDKEYEYQD